MADEGSNNTVNVGNSPKRASGTETVTPVVRTNLSYSHLEKPEKFMGTNFKRWQIKMVFFLTNLSLSGFLTDEKPEEDREDPKSAAVVEAWRTETISVATMYLTL